MIIRRNIWTKLLTKAYLTNTLHPDPVQADELAFLEEMIESAELLDCTNCGDDTLHAHEEIISIADGVTEVLMRCTRCMSMQPHLLID